MKKRKEKEGPACASVCVRLHFPCTKQETVYFMIINKILHSTLTKWWLLQLLMCESGKWNFFRVKIGWAHSSQNYDMMSLSGSLNLFFLDSFAVAIDFYCVRLYILANLQLIILSSFRTDFQGSLYDLMEANIGQWFFFANSLNLLLYLYEGKQS